MRSHTSVVRTSLLIVAAVAACGDNIRFGDTDASAGDDSGIVGDGALTDAAVTDAAATDAAADAPMTVVPRVTSNIPAANAMMAPRNTSISATFNVPMDRATLVASNFMLVEMGAGAVAGTVTSTNTTISFDPVGILDADTTYTATVTVGVESAANVAMAAPHQWTFRTGSTMTTPGVPVNLGTAGNFVLLGKSGITNVPTSMITGSIGVSPITSTAITGMPLTPDVSNTFATTPQVIGRVYAADFAPPTPTMLTTAVSDMETAFTAAAGRAPDVTELGAGMIGPLTLAPGVYKWSTGLLIPANITLSGNATDVWIFQIAQDLTMSSGTNIFLAGGAQSKNVFWQVSGQLVVNTGAHLEGNVLSKTAALLDTGASLNGRLLAQTLVTVRAATITKPAP